MVLRLSFGLRQTAAFDGCGGHGGVAKGRLRNHPHQPFFQLLKKGVRGKKRELLFRAARVLEGPDLPLVDAAPVVLPPVVRHQFRDAQVKVVVLPLWCGVQEGTDLIPADLGGSAVPLEPLPQEVRPRIDEIKVAIPGVDRVNKAIDLSKKFYVSCVRF